LATHHPYVTLRVLETGSPGADSYLEELIYAENWLLISFIIILTTINSILFLNGLMILLKHQSDRREYIYSRKELEIAETRDAYWNACQKEMVHKGEMHGYLRMYWGKKILKWAPGQFEA
jgi:deoxyribodipyrimidine photo-lyase